MIQKKERLLPQCDSPPFKIFNPFFSVLKPCPCVQNEIVNHCSCFPWDLQEIIAGNGLKLLHAMAVHE